MRCRTALSQYSNRIATASATLDLRLMKHTADSRLQFLLGLSMPCNRQGLPSTASFLTYTKNTFLHIHVILEGMTFNDLDYRPWVTFNWACPGRRGATRERHNGTNLVKNVFPTLLPGIVYIQHICTSNQATVSVWQWISGRNIRVTTFGLPYQREYLYKRRVIPSHLQETFADYLSYCLETRKS